MDAVKKIADELAESMQARVLVPASNIARIEFDGLCEPKNPGGVATGGYRVSVGDVLIHERGEVYMQGKGATNNVAEYYALGRSLAAFSEAIEFPIKLGVELLNIVGDSKLVVEQVNGGWKCNKPNLEKMRDRCRELIAKIEASGIKVTMSWIPRERNEAADAMSRQAYEAFTGRPCPKRNNVGLPPQCP